MFANARFDPACARHKNERDRHAEFFLQQPAIMFDDVSPDIILIRSLAAVSQNYREKVTTT